MPRRYLTPFDPLDTTSDRYYPEVHAIPPRWLSTNISTDPRKGPSSYIFSSESAVQLSASSSLPQRTLLGNMPPVSALILPVSYSNSATHR
jgi:hypothetical protein